MEISRTGVKDMLRTIHQSARNSLRRFSCVQPDTGMSIEVAQRHRCIAVLHQIEMDVVDQASAAAGVKKLIDAYGRIDIL